MSITTGQRITKTDVVNGFNNIRANIVNLCSWYKSSNANYSASAGVGGNGSPTSYITNPRIFPNGQLSTSELSSMSTGNIGDTKIIASTVYNALVTLINAITSVRNVNYHWYHQTNSAYGEIASGSATVSLLANTSSVSGSTTPYYTKSPNSTSSRTSLSIATKIAASKRITASDMNAQLNELQTKFNTFRNNNAITYNYYTCHLNCHENYNDRARR